MNWQSWHLQSGWNSVVCNVPCKTGPGPRSAVTDSVSRLANQLAGIHPSCLYKDSGGIYFHLRCQLRHRRKTWRRTTPRTRQRLLRPGALETVWPRAAELLLKRQLEESSGVVARRASRFPPSSLALVRCSVPRQGGVLLHLPHSSSTVQRCGGVQLPEPCRCSCLWNRDLLWTENHDLARVLGTFGPMSLTFFAEQHSFTSVCIPYCFPLSNIICRSLLCVKHGILPGKAPFFEEKFVLLCPALLQHRTLSTLCFVYLISRLCDKNDGWMCSYLVVVGTGKALEVSSVTYTLCLRNPQTHGARDRRIQHKDKERTGRGKDEGNGEGIEMSSSVCWLAGNNLIVWRTTRLAFSVELIKWFGPSPVVQCR